MIDILILAGNHGPSRRRRCRCLLDLLSRPLHLPVEPIAHTLSDGVEPEREPRQLLRDID